MIKNRLPFQGSRDRLGVKITQASKTAVVGLAQDNMVKYFYLQQLTCADKVAGDSDVRLGRSRFATRMIVANDNC